MAFPNFEKLIIDYISPLISPVTVATRVPDPVPAKFVQVRRSGGTKSLVRDTARIDVFAWANNEPDAFDLANVARTALHALHQTNTLGVACYSVQEFLGLRHDDDAQSGKPRYWFTVDITLRANL